MTIEPTEPTTTTEEEPVAVWDMTPWDASAWTDEEAPRG